MYSDFDIKIKYQEKYQLISQPMFLPLLTYYLMTHLLEFPMENGGKNFKDEREFTAWFGKQVRSRGGFWHKISDMSIDNKPCDSIIGLDGFTCLCEIKVSKNKKMVDVYKLLRPNQIFGLKRWQENGGVSIVVYYNITHHRYYILPFQDRLDIVLPK